MTVQNAAEPRYAELTRAIAEKLRTHAGPIVIASHVDPDGDALGSSLGLARALRAAGREVRAVMQPPRFLRAFVETGELDAELPEWPRNAVLVVLDVDNNDAARVQGVNVSSFSGEVVNVDHHGTNKRAATLSLVDPTKAATALMVMHVIEAMGVQWTPDIATPVLLGINTDTGSFKFANTTPEVLRAAADLVERGANLPWINEMLAQQSRAYYALLEKVLGSMEYLMDGLVVTARVNEEMLTNTGSSWEDVESYVGTIRSAEGTELACLFKDYGDRVKLSLRSRGRVSAQNIAVACGGGGHVAAAGATLPLPYAQARAKFEEEARRELQRVGLA